MLDFAYFIRLIKGLFLVTCCPVCGKVTDMGGICESCFKILDGAHVIDDATFLDGTKGKSIFSYEYEQVKSVVNYMKTTPDKDVSGYFATLMAGKVRSFGICGDCVITFVPRSREGFRENGFDQSEYLAKRIAKILGFSRMERLIKRSGRSKAQKTLSAKDRALNVKGRFCAVKRKISPRNIVIIDDVLTTGSSMKECVSVLKEQYPCAEIYFVTLAKNPKVLHMPIPERK